MGLCQISVFFQYFLCCVSCWEWCSTGRVKTETKNKRLQEQLQLSVSTHNHFSVPQLICHLHPPLQHLLSRSLRICWVITESLETLLRETRMLLPIRTPLINEKSADSLRSDVTSYKSDFCTTNTCHSLLLFLSSVSFIIKCPHHHAVLPHPQ